MNETTRPLIPPFIVPDNRIIYNQILPDNDYPIFNQLENASSVCGMICGLNDLDTSFIERSIHTYKSLRFKLVLILYPACPTKRDTLEKLYRLQNDFSDQAEFRLTFADSAIGLFHSLLHIVNNDNPDGILWLGSTSPFAATEMNCAKPCFVLPSNSKMNQKWNNWFDYIFLDSTPITNSNIQIPPLVPAKGSDEAAKMWGHYLAACRAEYDKTENVNSDINEFHVDPETGELIPNHPENQEVKKPSERLTLPGNNTSDKIAILLEKGFLVAIDKGSRVPPLDTPMKAEWFGVESLRQVGTASREIRYRISLLDENTARKINATRKKVAKLISVFAYPLGDGVRWIPERAIPLLEKEIEHYNLDGMSCLNEATGNNLRTFIAERTKKLIDDANQLYQDFFPGEKLADNIIQEIINDAKKRLEKALKGPLLPRLTYAPVGFTLQKETKWVSPWGQALRLLSEIARFPRKCISDEYFIRGLHLSKYELIRVMDVLNDRFVKELEKTSTIQRAKDELAIINNILDSQNTDEWKCNALMEFVSGKFDAKSLEKNRAQINLDAVGYSSILCTEAGCFFENELSTDHDNEKEANE